MAEPKVNPFRGYRADQIGIGNEGNPSKPNKPGFYLDPESEKEVEVFHTAAADALVRMGWVHGEAKRDKNGKVIEVVYPNRLGQRPEDNPEVIKLKAQLEAANKQLAAARQTSTPKTTKQTTKKGK